MRQQRGMMVVVSVAALLNGLSVACKRSKESPKDRQVVADPAPPGGAPKPGSGGNPTPTLEGDGCAVGQSGANVVNQGTYFDLRNGSVNSVIGTLAGVSGEPVLHSAIIRATSAGLETVTECTADGVCAEDATVTKQAVPMKICASAANFKRESLEGVAISSLYHTHTLFDFYNGLTAKSVDLGQVDLLLMPKFQDKYPTRTDIKSDNLSYIPSLENRPYIVLFPKGDAGKRIWPKVNLWESAWVIAHEASHHVFRMQFTKGLQKTSLKRDAVMSAVSSASNPIIRLPDEHDHAPSSFALQGRTRTVGVGEMLAAVNEGFADLLGFYAAGASSSLVDGLACFAKNRDVLAPAFANGTLKALDQTALTTFFSTVVVAPQARPGVQPCDVPNYQDEHAIGAIVVYGLHQLFAEASADNKAQADMTVKWIDAMPKTVATPQVLFEGLVRSGVQVAAQGGRTLTANQCAVVRKVFPVYATGWLTGTAAKFTCL